MPDDAIQTYAVRLGGPAGPAGALQITRSRLKVFDKGGGGTGNLLWQASLQEVRQFFQVGSRDTGSTVIVTTNPVLTGGGRREKKKLGPLL